MQIKKLLFNIEDSLIQEIAGQKLGYTQTYTAFEFNKSTWNNQGN